jgi:DNA-directed RNA polymerase III subunit RPC8
MDYVVEFRLVVFRPFKHEVLIGRISSATDLGIRSTCPTQSKCDPC